MRYLGCKDKLLTHIKQLLIDKSLYKSGLVFFDAFCGMGSVSNGVKYVYKIIINDILTCCTTYSKSRIIASKCNFEGLGFDPVEYLNANKNIFEGFFFNNYSQGGSDRMYFSTENAGRIDYFRWQIEEWYNSSKINNDEYIYLLGCLLESVSCVSNTAGVYGAFLKHWDSRALKSIVFTKIITEQKNIANVDVYNDKIERIISEVDCDILYLDPPYTQNQYGTQYHLLETLILNDNPEISKITGSRSTTPMRSDWSKELKTHILLDKIIAETKAKYIILSYNNDGFMSKDYIEAIFKRYGIESTYECRIIDYKKYSNFKTQKKEGHCEYLFYIEKQERTHVVIESPLNYTGSKTKMINQIRTYLPKKIDLFIDAFGGGFNVGVNIPTSKVIYNDINGFVKAIIESFNKVDTYNYLQYINKLIKKHNLSPGEKDGYLELRKIYNEVAISDRNPQMLYTLILYGFQQQIRFNGSHGFNNPVGSRYFNDCLLAKFISFARQVKTKNIEYLSGNYVNLSDRIDSNTFLYLDPPYRNTLGVYNDGKRGFEGWSIDHEEQLCKFLDEIHKKNAKFMFSYKNNSEIESWANSNGYRIIHIEVTQGRYNDRHEILILNY